MNQQMNSFNALGRLDVGDLDADAGERLAPRLAVQTLGVRQEPVEVEDDCRDHRESPPL